MQNTIRQIIRKYATEENIEDNSTLRSLGLDSLDVVEIQIDIENIYNIEFPREIREKISIDTTVNQILDYTKSTIGLC